MGEPTLPLTGACGCGAVRFEIDAALMSASYCHCTRCQRRTGTAVSANARMQPGSLRIVAGEDRVGRGRPRAGSRSSSAATAAPPSSAGTRTTGARSASGSARSTAIRRAPDGTSSSRTPRPGSRCRTTACRAIPSSAPRPEYVCCPPANRDPAGPPPAQLVVGLRSCPPRTASARMMKPMPLSSSAIPTTTLNSPICSAM